MTDEYKQDGTPTENYYPPGWSNDIVYALALSDAEIALRQNFVREYLLDRSTYNAAMRCGFAAHMARDYGHQLYNDSYVQFYLAQQTLKNNPDASVEEKEAKENAEEAETKLQIIEGLKREAFNKGPGSTHAARVAALSKLSAIYGLDKGALTNEDKVTHKGGVMVVPMMVDTDNWEKLASTAQAKLQQETLSDVETDE